MNELTSSLDLVEGDRDSDDYTKLTYYLKCVQKVIDVEIDPDLNLSHDVVTNEMIDKLLKNAIHYAPNHLDKKVFFIDQFMKEKTNQFLSLDSKEASNYEIPNHFYVSNRLYHPIKIMVCSGSFFEFYFYRPLKKLKYRPLLQTRADWDTFLIVAFVLTVVIHALLIVSVVTSSVSTWYIFWAQNNFEKSCPDVSVADIENETYKNTIIMQATFALMVIEFAYFIVILFVMLKTTTRYAAILSMIMMYIILIPIIMDIFVIKYLFNPHLNDIDDELKKMVDRYIEMNPDGAKSACSACNAPSIDQCHDYISHAYMNHTEDTRIPSIVCLSLTALTYIAFILFLILMRKNVFTKIVRKYY